VVDAIVEVFCAPLSVDDGDAVVGGSRRTLELSVDLDVVRMVVKILDVEMEDEVWVDWLV